MERLVRSLEGTLDPFEVLIVTGSGREGAEPLAPDETPTDPRLRVVRIGRVAGVGAAVREALSAARGEILAIFPPGAPPETDQVRALRETLEPWSPSPYLAGTSAADVAVGYRLGRAGSTLARSVGSRLFNLLACALFGLWLRDFGWICMYRRGVFERIAVESEGEIALVEILVRAKRAGCVVRQVACPAASPGGAAGITGAWEGSFGAFADLLRLRARLTFAGRGRSPGADDPASLS